MRQLFELIAEYPITSVFVAICAAVGITEVKEMIENIVRIIVNKK